MTSDASWSQILTMIDGIRYPNPMSVLVPDVGITDDDIVISTYPKVGTTWTQQIVHQLRTGGDEDFDDINNIIPYILPKELVDDNVLQANNYRPRAFKTHLIGDDAVKLGGRHITVFRDPIDTYVSMFHFMCGILQADTRVKIEDFYFGIYASLNKPTYYESMLSYYKQKDNPKFLILFYEDMKKDLKACIGRIADFIGVQADAALIDLVAQRADITYMKKHCAKFDSLKKIEELKERTREMGTPDRVAPDDGVINKFTGTLREGRSGYQVPEKVKTHIEAVWKSLVGLEVNCDSYSQFYEKHSIINQ